MIKGVTQEPAAANRPRPALLSPRRVVIPVCLVIALAAPAVSSAQRRPANPKQDRSGSSDRKTTGTPRSQAPKKPKHPLDVPLALARRSQAAYRKVRDYTAVFVKQERIDGKLSKPNYTLLKFRKKPFSVYMQWLRPHDGREVIYVHGRHDGKLIAHETGLKEAVVGTVELEPTSRRALKDSRRPVTQAGIGHIIDEMLTTWERERRYGEIDVKLFKNAKVGGRQCVCIQVYHPVPRREFQYCLSRVYIDEELKLPIRFEGYDWPRRHGRQPELVEAYTYTKLKLNPGMSEQDFDVRNPQYAFYR